MSARLELAVTGIGFWAPRLPDWDTALGLLTGTRSAEETARPRPAPALLAPNERRRAPDTVAIAIEAASAACRAADRQPVELPSVFASTHGDGAINDYLCATLAASPTQVSPTRFHNSVHNAASGYWTIGTGCTKPSTALSAGPHTFAAGLLEACTQALADQSPLLYIAYDAAVPGPVGQICQSEGMIACALVLEPLDSASIERIKARIVWQIEAASATAPPARWPTVWEKALPDNSMRQCLPLLALLAQEGASSLRMPVSEHGVLRIDRLADASDPV